MRIVIAIAGAALALTAAPGCRDKAKVQAVSPGGDGAAQPASPSFQKLPWAGSGSGGSGSAEPTPNVLDLPRSSRSAPRPTTRPLEKAQYEALAGLEVPGWVKDVRYLGDKALEVRYKTAARPILSVTIAASPCFDCIPPELPRWRAKEDALKNLLAPELRERADTLFEIGQIALAGAPLIYTYQLASALEAGADQNRQGSYSSAVAVYHNDGINQIRVLAQYADAPVATRQELANLAPKDDLQKIALAFLDAYTHAW